MKKILLILLLGLFLISFTSAIKTLGPFMRYDCIELIQTCGNCTYNNISMVVRTGENHFVYTVNDTMAKHDTYYNYSFCDTSELGQYIINGFGDPDGKKKPWNYNLFVTETGTEDVSVLNNPLMIILVTLALTFLFIGIKTGTIWLGFMSAIMFLLGGMYMTIYGLNDITNMYTQGVGISLIGVGIIIMFVSVYEGFLDDD